MTSALDTRESGTETLTPQRGRPRKTPGKHASGYDILRVLEMRDRGLTAQEIADKLDPPKHQTTVSAIIRKWGRHSVVEAKRLMQAAAADMAINVVENGTAKDHVNALKGLGVLEEQQQQGLTVIVGGDATVNIGVLLSPLSHANSTERIP